MKKALSVMLVLLMILSLSLVGCAKTTEPEVGASNASDKSSGSKKESGGVLKIINTSEGAASLGVPWEVINLDSILFIPYIEPLIDQKTNGEFEPRLATEWKVDTDKKTVRFTLRQGVKFTDGSDFNAEVAAWNIQQAIDNKIMNPNITGVKVTGEYEIEVQLKAWMNTIISTFSALAFGMISKQSFEKNGKDLARENPVGTGPFKLKEYVRGQKIVYEKNTNYWDKGKPYLDGIEYHFIRDVMTQSAAFQAAGDQSIDLLNTTSAEQALMLSKLGNVYTKKMPSGSINLFPSSNDPKSPLSKLEVRQAISYAIDRQGLVAARGFGVLTPAYQYIPEGWGAHLPDSYNASYNVAKAKELLAKAGYPNGFSTKMYGMPGIVDKDMVVAVQSMLAAVGIKAEVEFPDAGGYTNLRNKGWDGMLVQIGRAFPMILNTFTLFFDAKKDAAGKYYVQYSPSAWRPLEQLYVAQQAAEGAPKSDDKLLQEIHKLMMDNMVSIPLYNVYDQYIIKNNVHDAGFTENGIAYLPAEAWKSKK